MQFPAVRTDDSRTNSTLLTTATVSIQYALSLSNGCNPSLFLEDDSSAVFIARFSVQQSVLIFFYLVLSFLLESNGVAMIAAVGTFRALV